MMLVYLLGFVRVFVDALHIIPGVCITELPPIVYYRITLDTCIKRCACMDQCQFLSYRRLQGHACILYTGEPELGVDADYTCPGVLLYSQTVTTSTFFAGDTDEPCKHEIVCPDIVADANATVYGNTFDVGSKRLLDCDRTFITVGNASTVCEETGVWSEYGTCVRVCCKPEPSANMTFTDVELASPTGDLTQTTWSDANVDKHVFEKTRINISCDSQTVLEGPENIQCLDGEWTTVPECRTAIQQDAVTFCTSNADCIALANTECNSGTCQCSPGYKLHPSTSTCGTNCTTYGSTFIKFHDHALFAPTITSFHGISEADCMASCVNLASCRSVNYAASMGDYCTIKDVTALDNPGEWRTYSNINHYVRNCAL